VIDGIQDHVVVSQRADLLVRPAFASFTQIGDSWMGEGDDIYQDSPVVVDGDRATGSVVLYDAMTMEDTIELDFDVTIPSETFACR